MWSKIYIKNTLVGVIFFMLVNCSLPFSLSQPKLAKPEISCQMPASWKNIIPGQSTRDDVKETLGEPQEEVYSARLKRNFFLYPPVREAFGQTYGNQIVFRSDGIVDWLDVWVSNIDGEFHNVAEYVEQYGTTLDRVYMNGSLVTRVFGPDHIYVWSNCGVALTVVHDSWIKYSEEEVIVLAKPAMITDEQLDFRHPVPKQDTIQPQADVGYIVIRQFIFSPTDFASFYEVYSPFIPRLQNERFYRLNP